MMISEAIQSKDFERSKDIIRSYLGKYGIHNFPNVTSVKCGDTEYWGNFVFNADMNNAAYMMWKKSKSADIDAIGFFDDAAELLYKMASGESAFAVANAVVWNHLDGGPDFNVTQAVKLVKDVLTGQIPMTADALRTWMNAQNGITESAEELVESALDAKKARDKARRQLRKAELAGNAEEIERLKAEFARLDQEFQAAKSGITSKAAADNTKVILRSDPDVEALQTEFEKRATPEERFKDMENYINMVLKGLQPSAIICGAPGVGKTYRITQKVKQYGYRMMDNYFIIKGKCTPMSVYQTLFEYSHPGDLIVIDDADDIIKNELSINLLKAACDSSDERWVNYGTSKPIPASPEKVEMNPDLDWEYDDKDRPCYPRNFLFNGSIIIITNMAAGQLDTALRNRSLLCDLAFTTKECLEIIESLMPKLGVGKLSEKSKREAYDYLYNLNQSGADMEVSLRSFNIVANIIEGSDGDSVSAQRMIKEQMRLQFSRGGKKY